MQVCALLSVCVVLWCKNKTSDSREGYIKELTGWSENQGGNFSMLFCSDVSCGTSAPVRRLTLSQSTSFLSPISYWLWKALEAKVFWSTVGEPWDMANWRWKECMVLFLSICSLEVTEHINGSFLLPSSQAFVWLSVSRQQLPPGTWWKNCREWLSPVDWALGTAFIKPVAKVAQKKPAKA